MLDPILEAYVEEDQGREQLVRRGFPERVVDEVIRMVDRAEYKRRQAPPGIKISPKRLRPRPPHADHEQVRG